jgi:hypothetical protein
VIQGKSETLGPCDEAPAIGALVHESPGWRLHVIFGIWIGAWVLVGKCCLGKKIVKS